MIAVPLPIRTLVFIVVAGALTGCGSSSNGATPGGQGDGGTDASFDAEAGSVADASDSGHAGDAEAGTAYPAFTVDVPQILKNQGTVLTAPVIVTITFPSETSASTWEAYGDGIGASSFWATTTAEYGVGKATSGPSNHVRMMQSLPASLSYTDLQNFVTAALQAIGSDAGTPEAGASDAGPPNPTWPAPTLDAHGVSQTIYSLFIPPSITVTDPGTGTAFCTEGGLGYHGVVSLGTTSIAYSVTLECPSMPAAGIEESAAHETVESATDPYTGTANQGYIGFDANHLAWDLYTGYADELEDACQYWQTAYYQETGSFPYWIERSWSNKAAMQGHDPCVPEPMGPYHGMTLFPSEESTVTADLTVIGGGSATSLGFNVTIGQPITFHVGFFSDAPVGPWTIAYDFPSTLMDFDTSFMPLGNGSGTVMIDKTSGQNGDKATITVTPTAKGEGGFQVMAITWDPPGSSSGFLPRYLPVLLIDH